MDLRHATRWLVRSSLQARYSSALIPALNPCRWATARRAFIASPSISQDTPSKKSPKQSPNEELASLLDGAPPVRSFRTSPFSSPKAQASDRPGDSSTDILNAFRTSNANRENRGRVPTERMLSPRSSSSGPSLSNFRSRDPPRPPLPPLRLGPSIGRSVAVNQERGVDLGRGLIYLNSICSQNKVKSDFNRQRFHERPGLKRKRLKSERWRKRFMLGFKGMVYKVQDMKRKGW